MKIIYVADDGTQFDNEHECENYEFQKNINASSLIALGLDKKIIKLNETNIEDCYYVKISTEKDLKIFNELNNYAGVCLVDSVGEFYYDFNSDTWENLNEEIEYLEERISRLKEVKEIFK